MKTWRIHLELTYTGEDRDAAEAQLAALRDSCEEIGLRFEFGAVMPIAIEPPGSYMARVQAEHGDAA